jgi:UDP-N-acetylmuramoylalanine--D-glutamate ligase
MVKMNIEIEKLREKKIVIVGFGREGRSTYRFLRKFFPDKLIGIADKREIDLDDSNVVRHAGEDYLSSVLEDYDIVFKSPGISGTLYEIRQAKERGVEITSQTRLFFAICKGTIIGVTGTKGKSTTTSLIYHILNEAGLKAVLLGNIGKPCLDYLGEDFGEGTYFCFELSSYQLSDLDRSPHVGVFLNIFKEHLDYHGSFDDYFRAKSNIARHQNAQDFFIYNSDFDSIKQLSRETKAKALGFSMGDKNDFFEGFEKKDIQLAGDHNLNNVFAAALALKSLGIAPEKIFKTIKSFKPLEHRMQFVGEKNGIRFINDTLATIPEATIAAMGTFDGQIGSMILGGSDRGLDFDGLAKEIVRRKIPAVALFPDTGKKIWKAIEELGKDRSIKHIFTKDMKEAVDFCYRYTPKGKVCLHSPASPSFSVFHDYADRSNQFQMAVIGLK